MDGPWGDDPGYGAAYAGLKPSYWAVTSAAQPLRYIRAKVAAPGENIDNSKSTLLHAGVWAGRLTLRFVQTAVARHETFRDKLQSLKHVGRIALSLRSKEAAQKSIINHP